MTVADDTRTTTVQESLGGDVRQGLRWSLLNQSVGRVASVLSGIAMARILVPDDFGVYAAALAVVSVLISFNDLGLILAVVRWQGDLRVATRTASTLSIASSFVLYVLCLIGAPWFADLMNSPSSVPILRVLSLTVLIDGITATPHALLVRRFEQRRLAAAEFASIPVGIAVSVGLALAGFGPWSLALGYLSGNVVSAIVIVASNPAAVVPGFDLKAARTMLGFGVPLALTTLVEYLLLNADYVIVGRALGPTALGFYLLAFNVSNWPVSILSPAVRRVSIAGFAKIDAEARTRAFSRSLSLLVSVAIPICLATSLLALPLVRTLYGPKWEAAGSALAFLALLGGARVVLNFVFDLLVGMGRSRTTLFLQIGWLLALLPALQVGASSGIQGVAIAHVVIVVLVALPTFAVAVARSGVDLLRVGRSVTRPIVGAVAAGFAAVAARQITNGDLVELVVVGAVIVLVYTPIALPYGSLSDWLAARHATTSPGFGQ